MKITLLGRLETPIIISKPLLKKGDYWLKVISDPITDKYPLLSPVGKLVKGERKAPTVLRAYRGFVKVSCVGYNEEKLFSKISQFLSKRFLGNSTTDGYGRVKWLDCSLEEYQPQQPPAKKKFKIRKGLGTNYPKTLKRLLKALMLHDFVHTEKHSSKIYQQVTIEDEEIRDACLNHHNNEEITDSLVSAVRYYDYLASLICRKKPYKRIGRYDKEKGEIDFQQLAQAIEQNQHSAFKLYNYIYQSKELRRLVESLNYGHNSLRNHLLMMVNLAINDYYSGKLTIKNEKITIKRKNYKGKVSQSAKHKDELFMDAKDAEMHLSLTMNKADSQSSTNSMNEKARSIGREVK